MLESLLTTIRNAFATRSDAASVLGLISGTAGTALVQVGGVAAGFLVQVILARVMNIDAFGIYTIAFSALLIASTVTLAGMDRTFIRFLPVYRQSQQWGAFRGLLVGGSSAIFGISIALALLGAAIAYLLQPYLTPGLAPTLMFACCALPVFTLAQAFAGAVQALRRPILGQIPIVVVRPVLLAAILIAAWYALGDFGGPTAMAITAGALAFTFALYLVLLLYLRPRESVGASRQYHMAEWWVMVRSMWWIALVVLAMRRIDVFFLGAFHGAEAAGIYGAATRVADLVLFALSALNVVFMPVAAELYHANRRRELQRILSTAAWGLFLFSVPVSLFLILGGHWILGLFGQEFVEGHLALAILVAGQMATALTGPAGSLLQMSGHQQAASRMTTACFALAIVLNIALVPPFGMIGAALATTLATIAVNVALALFARGRLDLDPTVFGLRWR